MFLYLFALKSRRAAALHAHGAPATVCNSVILMLSGQIYTIEQNTNLLTGCSLWPEKSPWSETTFLTNYFNVTNSGTKFYRVRVE